MDGRPLRLHQLSSGRPEARSPRADLCGRAGRDAGGAGTAGGGDGAAGTSRPASRLGRRGRFGFVRICPLGCTPSWRFASRVQRHVSGRSTGFCRRPRLQPGRPSQRLSVRGPGRAQLSQVETKRELSPPGAGTVGLPAVLGTEAGTCCPAQARPLLSVSVDPTRMACLPSRAGSQAGPASAGQTCQPVSPKRLRSQSEAAPGERSGRNQRSEADG